MQTKKVSDSEGENLRLIQYADINLSGNLFGGKLMEWMDEIAGIVAMRHAGMVITTAAVDDLQFKKSVKIGDILVLKAKLTYVGNKSMEVRVDVYREERETGLRYVVNRAYFTEVAVDSEGRPVKVPYGLELTNPCEEAEWEAAKKRRKLRLERRKEGF
ncbi:MAG: acyl-CoA thioesterase [Lachnospiraceae bacterium]|nr:acyl-CoA thioesterase [Lachnospiraceae bacterium]